MKSTYLVLISLLLTVSCSKKETPHETQKVPVLIGKSEKRDIPYVVKAIGQLNASVEVDIHSQVEGYLTAALFKDGQLVEEGDLLFIVEQDRYKAALDQARSQLTEAKARLKYSIDFAETYGSLVGDEYVSRLQYEQGVQNVGVNKGAIEGALAAVKTAEINFNHTEIRSPTRGYVSRRNVDPGNLISSGGKPLTTVRKVVPIDVFFSIPSRYTELVRTRQKEHPLFFECVRPNLADAPMTGSVYFIDNVINENTGMLAMKGAIPNLDERGWPGEFVRVFLQVDTFKNVTVVPQEAVIPGQHVNFVYLAKRDEKDGKLKAELRNVKTGYTFQGMTIVEWGLNPGDPVITDGHGQCWPGVEVYVPAAYLKYEKKEEEKKAQHEAETKRSKT